MEIPPYHLPTLKNLGLRTWDRLKSFIIKAGQLIVIIVAVLAFLNSLGTDGSFGNEDTDKSVLSQIGKTIVPASSRWVLAMRTGLLPLASSPVFLLRKP